MKKISAYVLGLAAAALLLLPVQAMAQGKSRLAQILERGYFAGGYHRRL